MRDRTFDELKKVIATVWTDAYGPDKIASLLVSAGWVRLGSEQGVVAQLEDVIRRTAEDIIALKEQHRHNLEELYRQINTGREQIASQAQRYHVDTKELKEQHRIQVDDLRKDAALTKMAADETIADLKEKICMFHDRIREYQDREGWHERDKHALRADADAWRKAAETRGELLSCASDEAARAAAYTVSVENNRDIWQEKYEAAMLIVVELAEMANDDTYRPREREGRGGSC
jgi:hypothetical protein